MEEKMTFAERFNITTSKAKLSRQEARMLRLISSAGKRGMSYAVLKNRMKLIDDERENAAIAALEGLYNAGLVVPIETDRIYDGATVYKWAAKGMMGA